MVRSGSTFNVLHTGGRLFQQYATDMWCKTEKSDLDWIRHNQTQLRAELYQGLQDAINEGTDADSIGKRIVLPSTHSGSPRQMHELYQVHSHTAIIATNCAINPSPFT